MVAVVNSIAEPVFLLGHSSGAIFCLEAACRTTRVRKLVLYEPPIPIPPGIESYPSATLSRIQALLDGGDREGALTTFYREVVHVPPHEMEILRSAPNWSARVAAAYTIPHEMRGVNDYVFEPTRFGNLMIPTLLLLGGESPASFKTAIEAVHAALPESRVHIMSGQHMQPSIQHQRYSRARWLSSSLKRANSCLSRYSFLPAQGSALAESNGEIHRWANISR